MKIKTDLKKAPATFKCFKAGMVSSKLMHELHRASEESHEHDRGGTLFHLNKIREKLGLLKSATLSPGVVALARQIEKRVKSIENTLQRSKDLSLTKEESSAATAQLNALKESQGHLLKKMAAEACGGPKEA